MVIIIDMCTGEIEKIKPTRMVEDQIHRQPAIAPDLPAEQLIPVPEQNQPRSSDRLPEALKREPIDPFLDNMTIQDKGQ